MRVHYFLLYHLVAEAEKLLAGSTVTGCFTRRKNTLEMRFSTLLEPLKLTADLTPLASVFFVETDSETAVEKKVPLFTELLDDRVASFRLREKDRIADMTFDSGKILTFYFFGSQGNVFLTFDSSTTVSFKKKAVPDVIKSGYSSRIDDQASAVDRRLPKEILRYGFPEAPLVQQGMMQPVFCVKPDGWMSVWPLPDAERVFDSAHAMVRNLYREAHTRERFLARKSRLVSALSVLEARLKSRVDTGDRAFQWLVQAERLRQHADTLMAAVVPDADGRYLNVHEPADSFQISPDDSGRPADIAARWYGRARRLEHRAETAGREAPVLAERLAAVCAIRERAEGASKPAELALLEKDWLALPKEEREARQIPGAAVHQVQGFEIWVGRSASGNDLLLQKSSKEDLWLHARSVPGSHVIIRNPKRLVQIPPSVVEAAASWAAWRSKARGSALAPVQVTRRKFVRKPKGAAPGTVLVQREEVVMATPAPDGQDDD